MLSLQIETYQRNDKLKFPSRVVVKNELGERVLDTLVKADDPELQIGLDKQSVKDYSVERGPTMEQVRTYLSEVFRGRSLVGYHIEMQLADLGMAGEVELVNLYDCAKMFNENPRSGQQRQLVSLCKEYLHLAYKKPTHNYAVRPHTLLNCVLIGNLGESGHGSLQGVRETASQEQRINGHPGSASAREEVLWS